MTLCVLPDSRCTCSACAHALVEFVAWVNMPVAQRIMYCVDCGVEATHTKVEPPFLVWLCRTCWTGRQNGEPRRQPEQGQGRLI